MSHAATNWAIQQKGLKPIAKIVLWHLADCHNPVAGCFPTQQYLAEQAEISRASVNRHLDALENAGLIRREQAVDPASKRQRPTRYFLAFEPEFRPQDVVLHVSDCDTEPCLKNEVSRVSKMSKAVSQSFETLTSKGTSKEPMGGDEFFENLWQEFPKRPGASRETARKAFAAIDRSDWTLLAAAVKAQRQLFEEDCTAREESADQRARFAPFFGNWIASGAWRELGMRPPPSIVDDVGDLVVAGPGEPEYEAVARFRKRRPVVGKSGRCTFRRAEVMEAMGGSA